MLVTDLARALELAWSEDTAAGGVWDARHPALNQCAVTALIVQDFFGGEIMRCEMTDGNSHYWNSLGDDEIDLTGDQFDISDGKPMYDTATWCPRQYLFAFANTVQRYMLLLQRVLDIMDQQPS